MQDAGPQGAPIDRYVVLEYLAEGGMGAIYLGKKLGAGGFEKTVVLKQLLPEFTRQPEFIDLFLREARLSATLDHANIIHTIDLVTAGDEHFIVMEYLDGADLRTLLKRAKRRHHQFSASAGIYIARELLSALAYAHNKRGADGRHLRLIHRDISPSNILVSGNGEVKLTDFGIAKASTHNSVFYRVKGKVGYMSPEQARSEPLDARSDLYSLAVCLFEVITGERLFINTGLTTSADEMYSQPVPLLSKKVPGLPAELDKVMLRALAVDPGHRYQTAGEFQEALLRCAHRHGLMTSAPDLADHLRDVCGPAENWRDSEESAGPQSIVAGTEIYEEEEDDAELPAMEEFEPSVAGMMRPSSLVADSRKRRDQRAQTSITHLGQLQGVPLTSMFNLAGDGSELGAEPLVDLDNPDDFGPLPRSSPPGEPLYGDDEEEATNFLGRPPTGEVVGAPIGSTSDSFPIVGSVIVADQEEPRRRRSPWLLIALILLVGISTAAAIGLTGPSLEQAPAKAPAGAETSSAKPAPE